MTVASKVIEVIADQLETNSEDIEINSTLDSLGVDSLALIEISMELEDAFGEAAYLTTAEIGKIKTVQDIVDYIESRKDQT